MTMSLKGAWVTNVVALSPTKRPSIRYVKPSGRTSTSATRPSARALRNSVYVIVLVVVPDVLNASNMPMTTRNNNKYIIMLFAKRFMHALLSKSQHSFYHNTKGCYNLTLAVHFG